MRNHIDEMRRPLRHFMYIERKSERSLLLVPNIVQRQVNEKVIVGFSHLQERLATGDIREQSGGIAPYRIGRRHIYRRIKEPARPLGITRRIGCSMKKHVVDSGLHCDNDVRKCSVSHVNVSEET